MNAARQIGLVAAGITWRNVGLKPAGRALLRGLEGAETERTLAGMALVQAGERSVALIEEHLQTAEPSELLVQLLHEIGGPRAQTVIEHIATTDTEVGRLARRLIEPH